MNFEKCLHLLKENHKMRRKSWLDSEHFVCKSRESAVCEPHLLIFNTKTRETCIYILSMSDLFAEDWEIFCNKND